MTFLQPLLLWGLPLVFLPIVIHLLNRLRYRNVNWAAVMFLVKATRSSTRNARLRQYLVLFFRMLLLLMLIIAICRPLVGGWLGLTFSGTPDSIIILLDRSASMEAVDTKRQTSKRKHALDLFIQSNNKNLASSSIILIESVLRQPREIKNISILDRIPDTSPTDTAADIPAMLTSAIEYISQNKCGRTEIWIASDLQQSNWHTDNQEWVTLSSRISSLPQTVRVKVLDLSTESGHNKSIFLSESGRRLQKDKNQFDLAVDIKRFPAKSGTESFPLTLSLNGARSQSNISMQNNYLRFSKSIDLNGDKDSGGWGILDIPADNNLNDNACYFVYGEELHMRTVLAANDKSSEIFLRLAAAPNPEVIDQSCITVSTKEWTGLMSQDTALILWQGFLPKGDKLNALETFVKGGGIVFILPPASSPPANSVTTESDVFNISWGRIENAPKSKPYRISIWDELEGPLANTVAGNNLPVGELTIKRRQSIQLSDSAINEWRVLSEYSDNSPFLLRKRIGKGYVFACNSLPREDWSNLNNGTVLVPMIQRVLRRGAEHLTSALSMTCGEWQPSDDGDAWECVDSDDNKNCKWQAGVYISNNKYVALNRPSSEDIPDCATKKDVETAFGSVPTQVMTNLGDKKADKLQSEMWHMFIIMALLCMITESSLLLFETTRALSKAEHK